MVVLVGLLTLVHCIQRSVVEVAKNVVGVSLSRPPLVEHSIRPGVWNVG